MAIDGSTQQGNESWLERALDFIKPQPPAPPAPADPSPPAAITPGTPQNNIIQAQDKTRTDDKYQPVPDPDNPNGRPKTTFCNIATYAIVKAANGPTDGLEYPNGVPAVANDAARYLPLSKSWERVQPQEAQDIANRGTVVVGVQPNPFGHGHIVTVRPEIKPGVAEMSGDAPIVNNVGAKRNVVPADQAFDPTLPPPRYYAPKAR